MTAVVVVVGGRGAGVSSLVRKRSPSWGREGGEKEFVLLIGWKNAALWQEPCPQLPVASLQQLCTAWGARACKAPALALGQTLACPRFERPINAPAPLLWFISCFVGAKLQMAAYCNCARKGEAFPGLAFGCSFGLETLKAQGLCSERQGSACGSWASFPSGTSLARAGSRLPSQGAGCGLED